MEREKRQRQDVEKGKRKAEGDLKVACENIDELNKQKHDLETVLKRFCYFFSHGLHSLWTKIVSIFDFI